MTICSFNASFKHLLFGRESCKSIEERIIIIHNHLFKNAGTTIDWVLRKNFKNSFVDHRDDINMKKGAQYLKRYLAENPWIIALSTHHLRLPLPILENSSILTIMMLRHPIERVTSVYNFERKQFDSDTLGARYARNHSFKDYVSWRMRADVPPTIRNFHIYRCLPAPVNWKEKINDKDLSAAKKYVESVEMLGLVEEFDNSMTIFEKTLKPYFPNIDFTYKQKNVGQNQQETLDERIYRLRSEIGHDTYRLLVKENEMDLRLYNYVKELFHKRFRH